MMNSRSIRLNARLESRLKSTRPSAVHLPVRSVVPFRRSGYCTVSKVLTVDHLQRLDGQGDDVVRLRNRPDSGERSACRPLVGSAPVATCSSRVTIDARHSKRGRCTLNVQDTDEETRSNGRASTSRVIRVEQRFTKEYQVRLGRPGRNPMRRSVAV